MTARSAINCASSTYPSTFSISAPTSPWWRFLGAARVLADRFLAYRPDLVEPHLTWSRLLGLFAAWQAGVPRRIGFEQGDIYLDSWKFRAANFVGQHFAHRVVVCSRALADWNRRVHGISRGRLAVFHNCVDLARLRPSVDHQVVGTLALPAHSTLFAMVGTLGRGVNKRTDIGILRPCRRGWRGRMRPWSSAEMATSGPTSRPWPRLSVSAVGAISGHAG